MKVSLISTVFNEAANIVEYLTSISSMSVLPDEIVIVDGGSNDGTQNLIQELIATGYTIPTKLIVIDGCNIAQGRNIAINAASNEIIAVSDAGCRLCHTWLENITKPLLNGSADISSGWYEPDTRTYFEKAVALCTFPPLSKINPEKFLPSSRSIAFTKATWSAVGGYPEYLKLTAEDTLFDIMLKEKGFRFIFSPEAIVFWRPRKNLKSLYKQYYLYGYGDGEANIFRLNYIGRFIKIILAILLAAISIIKVEYLAVFFPLMLLAILKRNGKMLDIRYLIVCVFLAFTIEIFQIIGWIGGVNRRLCNR